MKTGLKQGVPMAPIIHKYTTPKYLTVNVFLVETENGVVVVDGATAVSSSQEIRDIIDNQIGKPLLAVLLTHGHPDHYVGVGEIAKGLDVPILASQGTIDFARYQDREKFDSLITRNYGDDAPAKRVFPNRVVQDGDVIRLDGVGFEIQDLGPCESDADSIWTVAIDGTPHVFLGDIVYNHTHGYFRDGHALNWVRALDGLLAKYDHTAVFHPAHGADCGTEILHWQKAYIEAFLGTVRSMLRGRDSLDGEDKRILVDTMRSFLPNDKLIVLMQYELDETIRVLMERNAV
jgi:glyoxylase-like metal-dependent hydrolase (beta-lactamase superfamily II)